METLQWAIGILVSINIAVTGWVAARLWAHIERCSTVSAQISRIDADVERMKEDIGTHESGMRGTVHQTASLCAGHEMRIALIERGKRP